MSEVPWPPEPMPAELHWVPDTNFGALHFIGPDGEKAVVHVTKDERTKHGSLLVWHMDDPVDGIVTVSPSIHYIGKWHSPNPVKFKIVESINA